MANSQVVWKYIKSCIYLIENDGACRSCIYPGIVDPVLQHLLPHSWLKIFRGITNYKAKVTFHSNCVENVSFIPLLYSKSFYNVLFYFASIIFNYLILNYSVKTVLVHTDKCSSQPCQNGGTCIASPTWFSCECRDGFRGFYCERCKSIITHFTWLHQISW